MYNKRMKRLWQGTLFFSILMWSAGLPARALPSASQLSTPELVGQTIMPRVVIGKHRAFKRAVQKGEVTGFFIKTYAGNITHPHLTAKNQAKFALKQRKKLQQTIADLQTWAAQSPHKIPLLLAVDYEGGSVTSPQYMGLKAMPSNMLLSATQDENLVRQQYAAAAAEVRKLGINMVLGPVADVNSNPRNPVIQTRSFGDNAERVGRFARVAVEGLQSQGVAAVVKHFPGHGDSAQDSHTDRPVTNLSLKDVWAQHISAFSLPLQTAWGVMTNHVRYPALDPLHTAVFSPGIIGHILRGQLHYNGVIFTDALDMEGVGDKPLADRVLDAYTAGNDVLLLTGKTREIKQSAMYPAQAAAVVEQELATPQPRLTRAQLEQKAQKVLDLKAKLAAFIPQEPAPDFDDVSTRVAQAGVTLVRDRQNHLPLQAAQICAVFFADPIFSLPLHVFEQELSAAGKQVRMLHLPVRPGKHAYKRIQACVNKAQVVLVGTSSKAQTDPVQASYMAFLAEQTGTQGKPVVLISLLSPYEITSYPSFSTVVAVYGPTAPAMQVAAQSLIQPKNTPARGVLPVQISQ